jgi:hypothetical protein
VNKYSETIELHGLTFGWTTVPDEDMGPPWEEHDGHGVVSDWTRHGKAPGERVLLAARDGSRRFYHVADTLEIARRDGWGISDADRAALVARLGRDPTQREITAAAVDADFDRMRQWCNDEWHWCGVVVELLDVDGEPTGDLESVWGIESDAGEYLEETARELAGQIAESIGDAATLPGLRVRA